MGQLPKQKRHTNGTKASFVTNSTKCDKRAESGSGRTHGPRACLSPIGLSHKPKVRLREPVPKRKMHCQILRKHKRGLGKARRTDAVVAAGRKSPPVEQTRKVETTRKG